MTDDKRKRLQRKIKTARAQLMRENPFFALLSMHLRFVANNDVKQISTNGISVFVDPEQLEKYQPNELCFLICHQIMHIIVGDIDRHFLLTGDEDHYERDLLINEILLQNGINRKSCVYVRAIPPKNKNRRKNKYDFWMDDDDKPRHMVDSDEFWSLKDFYGDEDDVIIESVDDISTAPPSGGASVSQNGSPSSLKETWQKRVELYSKAGSGTGIGNITDSIKRHYGIGKKKTVDWRKILHDFVQEQTYDYSFCPPDKRMIDSEFFLPDFNEKEFTVKDVLFMVDTSGSVDEEQLGTAYQEIKLAIEQFNGKLNGYLGFFDVEVTEPKPFECINDLDDIVPYGYGGTDFCCIFKYISENFKKASCLIIITDGWAGFPKKEDVPDIPILWLIDNEDAPTPPFGKTVRVI